MGRLQGNGSSPDDFTLDNSASPEGNAMVIYLNKGIDNIKFNEELYESGTYWERPEDMEGAGSYANSWRFSDIRKYLNNNLQGKDISKFEEDYLTNYEKNRVLSSNVDTQVFSGDELSKIDKTENKYYLPSGIWNTEFLSWGPKDISDFIPTDSSENDYPRNVTVSSESLKYLIPVEYFAKGNANASMSSNWTRSPYSKSKKASLASSHKSGSGLIFARNVDGSIDDSSSESDMEDLVPSCAPICKLNIENLNFASYSSMFNSDNSITKVPEGNGLYLKNKANSDDFKGYIIKVNNGILTCKSQGSAQSDCYMCLLLKDSKGNDYSASYPLNSGSNKEIDISKYSAGYYWFEKEAEAKSRDVIASDPTYIDAQHSDLSPMPTGDYYVYNTLMIIVGFSLAFLIYYFSKIKVSGGKKYE